MVVSAVLVARLLLLFAFFFSGLSTLIYEIVWIKQLVYLFGVTYHAITTVVTMFMAGLALGALAFGRIVDRAPRPLRIYALLELGIGAMGLLFPTLLLGISALYHRVHDLFDLGFFGHVLLRFALASLILLPPTLCMGATLPALARFFISRKDRIGGDIAWLYGVNTLGAALGCGLAGFYLIQAIGLQATGRLAAALNLGAAVLAFVLALCVDRFASSNTVEAEREGPGDTAKPVEDHQDRPSVGASAASKEPVALEGSRWLLGIFFLSGLCSIGQELLWTRITALLHPNAHTLVFALVLGVFLLGHGLGSALFGLLPVNRIRPLGLYAALQLGAGALTLLMPFVLVVVRDQAGLAWFDAWEPAWRGLDLYLSWRELAVVAAAVAGPALLTGLMFPLGSRLFVRRLQLLGHRVGALYFATTVGGIVGSFAVGFLLMPLLSARGCLFGLGGLQLALGVWLLVAKRAVPARIRGFAVASALAISVLGLSMGLGSRLPASVFVNVPTRHRTLYFRDGRSTTDGVFYALQRDRWLRVLFTNGEFVAPGAVGVWLPLSLHPRPSRVMILAFATGDTTAMALRFPGVQSLETADISDGQRRIAHYFSTDGARMFRDPRFTLTANDGRNHLLTRRSGYDVIFSNVAAYANYLELSTVEFFRICRERLNPGGLFGHKLHQHMLTMGGFQRVVATFVEVFPEATLWQDRVSSVLMLLGSTSPQRFDTSRLRTLGGRGLEGTRLEELAMRFLMDGPALRSLAAGAAPLRDDRPPRLYESLTLIDTGSDFLSSQPVDHPGQSNGNAEREILALIHARLRPASSVFVSLSLEEAARAHKDRLRLVQPPDDRPSSPDGCPQGEGRASDGTCHRRP